MASTTLRRDEHGTIVVSFPLLTDLDVQSASPRGLAALVTKRFEEAERDVADALDRARTTAPAPGLTRPDSTLPGITQSPTCRGCGTSVEHTGDLCPNCEHKAHLKAPEATIALVHQGEPPYKREGNFRDLPGTASDDDIQRVTG